MEPSTDAGTPPGGGEPAAGHPIDPEFASLPLREFAGTALQRARELGAEHADFRAERIRGQEIGLSDGHLETLLDADEDQYWVPSISSQSMPYLAPLLDR